MAAWTPSKANTQLKKITMQRDSIQGIKETSQLVYRLAQRLKMNTEPENLSAASPFIGSSLYLAASEYVWFARESPQDSEIRRCLDVILDVLRMLGGRWKVNGQCSTPSRRLLEGLTIMQGNI